MGWQGRISTDHLDGLPIADQIDMICDRFEQSWWSGAKPNISDYLGFVGPRFRPRLFIELLLVDWEFRSHDLHESDWSDYRRQFPEFAPQIEEAWLKQLQQTPPIEEASHKQLGQFTLLQHLGSGGSGCVWKAIDARLQRVVAVKIPHGNPLSENELTRFLREGRAAAQLTHPCIVSVFEVGHAGQTVFAVSAYVEGINLREWLATMKPTPRQAAEICRQIADALHYAHERGIIHRDLKPSNILLDASLQPHITDFGLAKFLQDDRQITVTGEIVGTPAYMSPEQAGGQGVAVDCRADVYSLGVLFYEMLVGHCPFVGDPAAVLHQVIFDEPSHPRKKLASIPRDLETVCLKALAKHPDDRYWTAQEMAVDLSRFLDGRPILARRPSPLMQIWRWLRKRPATAAALALGCVLLGTIIIAGQLLAENKQLLGLRSVNFATEPPDARLAIVPCNDTTGELIPDKAIRPRGRTPLQVELGPGDYLVVAVLDDGRFHEVYRHVPENIDAIAPSYPHLRWNKRDDKSIEVPHIVIPALSACYGMAMVHANENCESFYMDRSEFTVAEFLPLNHGHPPLDKTWLPVPNNFALTARYDSAMTIAEKVGKRLPTEREYEAALMEKSISARSIHGLLSGVAEWTVTRSRTMTSSDSPEYILISSDKRTVRGGNLEVLHGNISTGDLSENIELPAAVDRSSLMPGLGFRCVRSIAPRFLED